MPTSPIDWDTADPARRLRLGRLRTVEILREQAAPPTIR
jgi:hypothetical protein